MGEETEDQQLEPHQGLQSWLGWQRKPGATLAWWEVKAETELLLPPALV